MQGHPCNTHQNVRRAHATPSINPNASTSALLSPFLPAAERAPRPAAGAAVRRLAPLPNSLLKRPRQIPLHPLPSFVTTNHFDVDSFLAVWCYINRAEAVAHEGGELGGPVGRMAV